MANKTVTHVVSSLRLGGAERFVLDLSSVQKDNNWSPQIISFGSIDDTLVAEANSLNIPLKIIDKNLSKKQRFTKIIQIFINQKKDAILHIHSPAALKQAAMFLFLNRLNRVQVIYTRHGCAPLAAMNWRLVHFIARPFIHKVTFVSLAGLEAFKIHYPWPQSKLKVIENGVLVPSTSPKKLADSNTDCPFRIGSVGRMVALKGQINLLKALLQIKTQLPPPEVHFFGSGPEQESLQKFTKEHQLESLVFFHGTVLNRQKVYDSIDLLVVCSETEGLSLAIMESMARGIPVIATEVGGNPQLVTPNETGFLVPYNEVEPLVHAILAIKSNPTLYDLLAENAKRFIASKYSLQTTLEQYFQSYR